MTSLGMTGRAEVATDPVGNDNTDILVRLQPINTWKTAADFDDLSEILKRNIEEKVSGTFVSVSQPIEDRTNELISGSRADVQIQLLGSELNDLTRISKEIAAVVRNIQGSGDVRVERILGQPLISAVVDRHRMARYGVKAEDALMVLQAAREGVRVGELYEVQRRFDIRVLYPPSAPSAAAIGELFVETSNGEGIPLREVATLSEGDGPVAIRRQNRERAVRVDVNLRGRDLVSWVAEAQQRVRERVRLPGDYRIEWGGQFENFERASARLTVVVPVVVCIIFGMLLWMFQNMRFALAVFALVPLSLMGGMAGLLMRGLAFSLPAAIGFIALGGIGVLNGVVVANEVRRRMLDGEATNSAIVRGFAAVVRAILTTAAVAALGFLPMAMATGAGAEVQRPLATAVVIGMAFGTMLSLAVLPGVLTIALRGYIPEDETGEDWAPGAESPPAPTKAGSGSAVGDAHAST
jgi:cobalt-zinc-cadmium resistance protein CzcA